MLESDVWMFLYAILPFLKELTTAFWAFSTWWIPVLAILEVWGYGYRRAPLRYDPAQWGIVFPLGMYAASRHQLAKSLDLPFLMMLSRVFCFLALLAWAMIFIGLICRLGNIISGSIPADSR